MPFFAAVHASQTPAHAVSQQTPSAQWPVTQSLSAAHCLPWAHFTEHDGPPQSTSVSPLSFMLSLHWIVAPHRSVARPQKMFCCAQLTGQHAQVLGIAHGIGPQVLGAEQLASLLQPMHA